MPAKLPSSPRARAALIAAAAAGVSLVTFAATNLTMPWEAKSNVAYWDKIGHRWTVCYGETLGVKQGDHYTDQQCLDMLTKRMDADYLRPLQRCIAGFDQEPFSVRASFLDLSWNVGVGAVCKSTAARLAAAKDWAGACEMMTHFNMAAGQVIAGLDHRRKDGDATRIGEREVCLAGVA